MLKNFPPEVVIWWMMKMYFWGISEYTVRIMGLVSFYGILSQAVRCLKFWNMTKSWDNLH